MIASSEIGPDGEVLFNRPLADQRFLEPYSGLYYQISGAGLRALPVALAVGPAAARSRPHSDSRRPLSTTATNSPSETLRIIERDVRLPGSPVRWRFQVAQSRDVLDEQIGVLRRDPGPLASASSASA